ncbi:MAG: hypothetical protein M3O91_05565 [Chloroflexota bacterium]|nr:hypothetical protein [Chloroflexota bacterium]
MTLDRELALAAQHPRGTERKRLGPFRAALRDPAEYARLPEVQRDVIVQWAETRRLIAERHGIDNDASNLADPLLPAARLRAHVIEGERIAAGLSEGSDPGGDVLAAVAAIRGRP